jgi:hypothetical protein
LPQGHCLGGRGARTAACWCIRQERRPSNWFSCTYDTFTVHAVQIASAQEVGAITGAMFPAWANAHELIVVRQTPDSTSSPASAEAVNLDTGASRRLGAASVNTEIALHHARYGTASERSSGDGEAAAV